MTDNSETYSMATTWHISVRHGRYRWPGQCSKACIYWAKLP